MNQAKIIALATVDEFRSIINLERAWFSGTFRIKDREGRILAENEIAPLGRYGGTLVITLDSDGSSQFAFNEIPESHGP